MEKEKLKNTAKEIIKKRGKVLGEIIELNKSYIIEKEGEVGIRIVEEEIKDLVGINFNFNKINKSSWYPQSINVLIFLICKQFLKWSDEDIYKMGSNAAKISFISKSLFRLISPEEMFKKLPLYWKKYYDFGELIPVTFDREEKYLIVRIKDFKCHPLLCLYTKGYFLSVFLIFMKTKNAIIEETQCSYMGGLYDEYKISWF